MSGFVTTTSTVATARAPVTAVIVVALITARLVVSAPVSPVVATPPIDTVAPLTKLVPVIVTRVPPAVLPELGTIEETVGEVAANVKPSVSVSGVSPGFVTMTSTSAAARAGVVAVMVVMLTLTTLVAATPPIETVAPLTKLVPEMVTAVPPPTSPVAGTMPVIPTRPRGRPVCQRWCPP